MATQKLQVIPTIKAGIIYGLKNIPSLLGMVILYVLTVWIPYLNVGTTIGLQKAIIKIGRGEVINPLDIFAKENRQNLGDYFLLMGLMSMGIAGATAFMFIPGLVVSLAWGFAMYFFLDKGLSPTKALKVSYKSTDGEKWTIFWVVVVACFVFSLVGGLMFGLSGIKYVGWLFAILGVAVYLIMFAALVAIEGVMYAHFSEKADEIFADKIAAKEACGCAAPAPAPAPEPEPAPAPEDPAAPAE
jgi:hypothetical protein